MDCCCCLVAKSCLTVTFVIPWTEACQAPLPMGVSRQENWSGLTFLSPGDLSDPGIKFTSLGWQPNSLPLSHLGKCRSVHWYNHFEKPIGSSIHTHTHTHTYTHTHTLWHNSILMHILNRNANAFIQKLCKDVHSTTLQPNPELKKTQMSKRVKLGNKMWNIHAMEYYTTIKIYKPFVTTWMNLINIMLSERSHTQESIIYYFISVKFKIM